MLQFFQVNISSIVSMIVMVCVLVTIELYGVKGYVDALDKERIAKGITTMTDDEKELIKQSFRRIIIKFGLMVLIAYAVSLISSYFL